MKINRATEYRFDTYYPKKKYYIEIPGTRRRAMCFLLYSRGNDLILKIRGVDTDLELLRWSFKIEYIDFLVLKGDFKKFFRYHKESDFQIVFEKFINIIFKDLKEARQNENGNG
jgi:hypothetical protein